MGINSPGQPHDGSAFTMEQAQAALQLARAAGFHRTVAALHHLRGDYSAAVLSHLQTGRLEDVFEYCAQALSGGCCCLPWRARSSVA